MAKPTAVVHEFEPDADEDEQDHADDADRPVLAVEVGGRALLHGGGDLAHALVAGGLARGST